MSSKEEIPRGWIKVKSKSRPDKFYFFNREKNLSVWQLEDCKNPSKMIFAKQTEKKLPQKSPTKGPKELKGIQKRNIAADRMKKLKNALSEEIKRGIDTKKKSSAPYIPNIKESTHQPQSKTIGKIKEPTSQETTVTLKTSHNNLNPSNNNLSDNGSDEDEKMEIDEFSQNSVEKQVIDEEEPMEWEEIDERQAVEEVHNVRTKEYESTTVTSSCTSNKIKTSKTEFYIIVDTNVLLSNLKLVRDIKGKTFKSIGKAVIYLPYVVLCELDRLKMREDKNIARQARSAINYIDNCFSAKDEFMIGQSALESSRELIEIDNGDDYIINSSLQVKQVTNKVIVLSNDKNLRNKASVNDLEAFSSDALVLIDLNETNKLKFVE